MAKNKEYKIPKVVGKRKKRIGRGHGSGKGAHTVGRGMKGQRSRGKIGILFEGVKVKKSLLRRLPLHRGKGKFTSRIKPLAVKTGYLNILKDGSKVNIEALVKVGIVKAKDAKTYGVKILSDGKLTKKLFIELPTSKSAAKEIEKKGGKVNK